MQAKQTNPLNISNSESAKVEAYQKQIIDIFDTEYASLMDKKDFYTNLTTITRFSIAREFKKEKTIELWRNWVIWYQKEKPNLLSPEDEVIQKIHTSGKYRYLGKDKLGNPILIIRMKYHVKGLANVDENFKYLMYMIEKGSRLSDEVGTGQLSIIYDRRELEDSDSVSKESMKKFMPILNDCYPERLRSFYVLGANMFYRAMWKVVSIFISKRTEQKVNLLEDVSDLKRYIGEDNLAVQYGGVLELEGPGKSQSK